VSGCFDRKIVNQVIAIINQVNKIETIYEIRNIKKLTGFHNKYRIRIKDYRIGIIVEDEVVIFAAFDHRSDIYKYFP
jgi:mRNA interferase RelE/StbE